MPVCIASLHMRAITKANPAAIAVAVCFLISLLFTFYIALFFSLVFLGKTFLTVFFLSLVLPQIMAYFWLILRSDAKAKFVEEILPDVLQLMSSNLRAGMTTDKALLLSARPEFGPFQDEINQIGKEITIGKDLGDALLGVNERINSERLKKTMTLIVSGLKSGGELASLLDQAAKNLRKQMLVDSKIRANVMMYVIFIFIAVCFGAPFLFGLSSFLVEVLTQNLADIQMPETTMMDFPMTFSEISIDIGFVINFSLIFIATSAIFGSLIIGSISKGKEREGLKFLPILLALSIGIFLLLRFIIKNVLGGLFGF
jgi:archaeal flagellar protein FlaJ